MLIQKLESCACSSWYVVWSGPEDGQTSVVDWNFDTNPRHGNDAFEQLFSFFDQEYFYSYKAFLIDEQLGFTFCSGKFDQRSILIESGL